ncbi:hypothetical protein OS493_039330, partial [Desmophyllum pertusum]
TTEEKSNQPDDPASSNPLRQRQNREKDLRTETDMLRIRDEGKTLSCWQEKKRESVYR